MLSSALPRGFHAVLVTSGQLRHLDPHLQVPPLLLVNTLISAFSRAALPRLAIPLLRRLLAGAHPLRPDAFTFPPLVRAAPSPASAAQLHSCALRLGLLHPNVFASGSLVHAYLRFGRIADAYRLFDEMPERDVAAWNAMVSGLCRNARATEAVALFGRMVGEGFAGNAVTVSSVLPMCVLLGDRVLALVMHVYAVKHGLDGELFVCNAMIDVYSKLGMLKEARRVFEAMALRDLVTWNSIISGYEQGGQVAAAVDLFHGMRDSGVSPDVLTLVSLASAVAQCGDDSGAKSVHCYVMRRGWDVGDIIAGNAMVDMYAKLSKIDSAQRVFDSLPARDVVSWNTLITGYMQNGLANEAINTYNHMQRHEGLKPIQGTFVSVLPACSHLGALQQGMRMHALAVKTGLFLDVYVGTCLIDLYAKCGKLVEAMLLFQNMDRRSTGPWNAIIAGLGVHGHGEKALSLFSQMQQEGIKPDHVTFVSLLASCSHAGLVDRGRSFFAMMQTMYGILPIAKHYACIVDMLGRAGQLDEAFEFIQDMPIKPDSAVWGALLGACRIYGNVEMGKMASQNLFELDPENVGYYVLMSNMYAKAGKWDGVDEVRSLVRRQNLQKTPGWSSIEVKKAVSVFYSGTQTEPHPQNEDIQRELQHLMAKMRSLGYVPDYSFVLQDVEEDEKEQILNNHSERLAIAYGIIRSLAPLGSRALPHVQGPSPPGHPIKPASSARVIALPFIRAAAAALSLSSLLSLTDAAATLGAEYFFPLEMLWLLRLSRKMVPRLQKHAEKSTASKEGLNVNDPCPKFCKIISPEDITGKLRIPQEFNTFLENEPRGVISLKGPSRNTWRAELVQDSDGLCFLNGWKEFSVDHQIKADDFLMFRYVGHSQFSVLVLDGETRCQKQSAFLASPGNAQVVESDNAGLGIDADDTIHHYVGDNEGSNAMDPLRTLCIDGSETSKDTENDKGIINGEHAFQHDFQKNGSLPKISRSLRMTKERLSRYSFPTSMESVKTGTDSDGTSEPFEGNNEGDNATGYLQGNEKTMDHANNGADDIQLEEGIDGANGLHHEKREEMRIDLANALDTSVLPRQKKLADIIKMCSPVKKFSKSLKKTKAVAKIHESKVSISQRLVIIEKHKEKTLKGTTRLRSYHPFTMEASNVYPKCFMEIPSDIVKKYLPKANAKVALWDPQGRSWEVCYMYCKSSRRAYFCRGWGAFVVGNNIEKDDICLFHFFQKKNIKVEVFRVLQETTQ
ncbi:hypothetical protein EJB05_40335, partial [Eragrostis curvula]